MPRSALFRRCFQLALILLTLLLPCRIFAVSCATQAQMTEADRAALVQSAKTLASAVQSGNVAAVQSLTIPAVKNSIWFHRKHDRADRSSTHRSYRDDRRTVRPGRFRFENGCGGHGVLLRGRRFSACMWISRFLSFPKADTPWR